MSSSWTDMFLKQLAMLTDEAKSLESEAFKGSDSSLSSPHHSPSHGLRGSAYFHTSSDVRTAPGSGSRSRRGL